jgi:NTE family protein
MPQHPSTGLVLSGGGVRGAYEVGVVQGVIEALNLGPNDAPPFNIFAGTSVGAINAAYMVAHSHRGDFDILNLRRIYENLNVSSHLRLNVTGRKPPADESRDNGRSFIDPRPLELLVRRSVDWNTLHSNVDLGHTQALLIAAFNIVSGQTTIFAETHDAVHFQPSLQARRVAFRQRISPDHVLASAAIPLIFPSRRIDNQYYCDGGIRFNTPISPAIRAGADRLVVISLTRNERVLPDQLPEMKNAPSAQYVAGKLLNALLLDPFEYDLAVLKRINKLVEMLESILTGDEIERVHEMMSQMRGTYYRKLETLVFTPSEDIGRLAHAHLRTHLPKWNVSRIPRFLLRRAALQDATWEADWAAFVLFDGDFATQLVDLGYRDALARREDIRRFYSERVETEAVSPPTTGR